MLKITSSNRAVSYQWIGFTPSLLYAFGKWAGFIPWSWWFMLIPMALVYKKTKPVRLEQTGQEDTDHGV